MGGEVTIPNDELTEFDLPRVCVVTGATSGVVFKDVKFAWYPRWVVLLVLLNILIAAVVGALVTRRVSGRLPFTEEAFAAWRRGRLLHGLSVVLLIVAIPVALGMTISEYSTSGGVLLVVLAALFPLAIWQRMVRNRSVAVRRITKTHTTLSLPSDQACERIRTHLSGGRPPLAPPG